MEGEHHSDARFQPGKSGNPKGRPSGSRNKIFATLDAIGDESAEAIVRAVVDKAKDGDVMAAKAILERVWPVRKGSPVSFHLPSIAKVEELPAAVEAVAQQVACGDLSPEEGASVVALIDTQRRAIDTSNHAERLAALEEVLKDYLAKEGRK